MVLRLVEFGACSMQVDVLCAGFPCISISPLTTTPGSVNDEGCSSGHGFHSIMRYVRKKEPRVVLLENVQTLFHRRKQEKGARPQLSSKQDESCPFFCSSSHNSCLSSLSFFGARYDIVRDALVDAGYDVAAAVFNTLEFGPAQSRNRAWIIAGKKPFLAKDAIQDAATYKVQTFPLSHFIEAQDVALGQLAAYPPARYQKAESGEKWKDTFNQVSKKFGKATHPYPCGFKFV